MYWGVMSEVEEKWRKGPWTTEEDRLLVQHVNVHGEGRWNSVATLAGTIMIKCLQLALVSHLMIFVLIVFNEFPYVNNVYLFMCNCRSEKKWEKL